LVKAQDELCALRGVQERPQLGHMSTVENRVSAKESLKAGS